MPSKSTKDKPSSRSPSKKKKKSLPKKGGKKVEVPVRSPPPDADQRKHDKDDVEASPSGNIKRRGHAVVKDDGDDDDEFDF